MVTIKKCSLILFLGVLFNCSSKAQDNDIELLTEEEGEEENLLDMSLEDLMDMEITSVSKKAERLQDVSSAIYVITNEDIKKSSATRFVDLLKSVPGFWAVSSSYQGAISYGIREPANFFAGSVLVLIDGVPIQNPQGASFVFSTFDIPLEMIDKIEIIKGPGGTIYGANAATGVINIFTKKTEGVHVKSDYGSNDYRNVEVGGGFKINDKLSFSAYSRSRQFDGFDKHEYLSGNQILVPDGMGNMVTTQNKFTQDSEYSHMISNGLNLNFNVSKKTLMSAGAHFNTFHFSEYNGIIKDHFPVKKDSIFYESRQSLRAIFNGKLEHKFSDNHSLFFKPGYSGEFVTSNVPFTQAKINSHVYDFEVQDNFKIGERNSLTLGTNYRLVQYDISRLKNPKSLTFEKPQAIENLYSAFFQNKISLMNNKLDITAGIKAETWTLVSNQPAFLPSLRFTFKPNKNHTLWGGASLSNTTPGYSQARIELSNFEYPSMQEWTSLLSRQIMQQLIDFGIPPNLAQVQAGQIAALMADSTFTATFGNKDYAGKRMAITNANEIKRTTYSTFELGYRTSAVPNLTFETNLFYTFIENGIGVELGKGLVPSNKNIGDTIVPYYYTNTDKGTTMGAETMIRTRPTNWLTLEFAHTFMVAERKKMKDGTKIELDQPATPEHIVQFKGYLELPHNFSISVDGLYATEYNNEGVYIPVEQRFETLGIPSPNRVDLNGKNNGRFILNTKIEKKLMDGKLSVYGWASDLTRDPEIEIAMPYNTFIPRQVHRIYGLGIKMNL